MMGVKPLSPSQLIYLLQCLQPPASVSDKLQSSISQCLANHRAKASPTRFEQCCMPLLSCSLSCHRNSSGVGEVCCVLTSPPIALGGTQSIVRSQSLTRLLRIAPIVQFLLPIQAHTYLLCPIHQPPRSQDLKIPRFNYTLY